MRVSVVFTGAIMSIGAGWFVWRELFEPNLVIMVKSALVVVDEDRGGDVHGVDQAQAILHSALVNEFLDLGSDIDEAPPGRDFEPEMFGQRFQVVRASENWWGPFLPGACWS
jgi:hypothetical protein